MEGYQGQLAHIPLGQMGIMTDLAPGQIPPNALIRAYNIDYGPGFIQKAPGDIRYNLAALSSGIVSLFDYWPDIVTQRMLVATADGKIYRDIGDLTFSASTAITTGLGALDPGCRFIQGGNETAGADRKVFFFRNGNGQPQVLSGDTALFAELEHPASDWTAPNYPKFGLIHRNRLWAFMGNRYYASMTSDHENFTDVSALSGTIGPGDGGDALSGFIYKGKMIIFKEGDIVYYLNDSDTSSANWYFAKLGEGFGVASIHAAIMALDDLLVSNNTGSVTSYAATQKFGDVTSGDIFRQAKVNNFFRENLSTNGIPYSHALWYQEKHRAYFTGRTKAGTANDAIVVLDVQNPDVPRYLLYTKNAADCLALRRDITNIKRPMYGAADGYVYLMDREDRSVGVRGAGSAFTGEFWTPPIDLKHLNPDLANKDKIFDFVGMTFIEEGNHAVSVDVWVDGRLAKTLTFTQTIDTNYCGAFVLGSSRCGGWEEKRRWQPLGVSGRTIAFRCYNSGNNQNFKICQLSIGFQVAAEDATRLTAT